MLVIYKGQASWALLNFDPSAVDSWKRRMESSESGTPDDANSPKRKKMRLWNPKIIKLIISVLTPFLLSPLAFSSDKVARCGFVILWMAIYWMLEPVSIAVTALLPVPLMPLLGILDAQEVAPNYMKEVLMMFMGGLGVAIAAEHSKLHERIALKVLLAVGADTKWLMLGFMLTTMFLSMWVSNTATTAMMVPIISAVMNELNRKKEGEEISDEDEFAVLHKTLLLSVAYSANTGGTGTITGTSPNMIFKGYVEDTYPESHEITYASWMAYNVPPMIMVVLTAWLVLQAIYIPCWHSENTDRKDRIRKVISAKYNQLGGITFHEAGVLFLFILLVLLFFFRDPKFMPGWASLIPFDKKIGDAVPAIGILFLMFVVPAEPRKTYKSSTLLTWKVFQEKMPWGLLILLGGGYALADGAKKSGLSEWLGKGMSGLSSLPPSAILVIMWLFTTCSTEIMSNSTITAVTLPIVTQMKSGSIKWLGQEMSKLTFFPPIAILITMWIFTTFLTEIMSNTAVAPIMLPLVNQMKSGLSQWMGKEMSKLSTPSWVLLLIIWLVSTSITEFMSNSACATIMIPIVNQMVVFYIICLSVLCPTVVVDTIPKVLGERGQLTFNEVPSKDLKQERDYRIYNGGTILHNSQALAYKVNPIYFMLPVTVISSQAFMLPVATGPNAIVYATRMMKTSDMIKAGLVMNLLAGSIQMIILHTYGNFLFKLDVFPDWAKNANPNTTPNTTNIL